MPVRPRKHKNRSLPPNLYTNPLRYRHPKTGKVTSWRKYTLEQAIEAAKILNSMLMKSDPVSDVIGDKNSLKTFLEVFLDTHLPGRQKEWGLSPITVTDYTNKVKALKAKDIAKRAIAEITTHDLFQAIKEYPPTQRNRYRSLLILIFDYALGEGLVGDNPARPLLKSKENVRRQRLTIEGFNAVYEQADKKTQDAMMLALRSLQRREDLVRLKRSDIREESGRKWIQLIQQKTKAAVKIYMDRLLESDVAKCKDDVVSDFILHYGKESNKRRISKPLTPNRLTNGFREARDKADFFKDVTRNERPTFHEIRALGAILYLRAGRSLEEIQRLCGHKDVTTTKRYLERHGVEFVEAQSGEFAANVEQVLHHAGLISE